MKRFVQIYISVLLIVLPGFINRAVAQQLASEKPLTAFYSKTTKARLGSTAEARRPVAVTTRQALPSEKALPQPSVPQSIKAKRKAQTQKRPSKAGTSKTASEKPVDMERIKRERRM